MRSGLGGLGFVSTGGTGVGPDSVALDWGDDIYGDLWHEVDMIAMQRQQSQSRQTAAAAIQESIRKAANSIFSPAASGNGRKTPAGASSRGGGPAERGVMDVLRENQEVVVIGAGLLVLLAVAKAVRG